MLMRVRDGAQALARMRLVCIVVLGFTALSAVLTVWARDVALCPRPPRECQDYCSMNENLVVWSNMDQQCVRANGTGMLGPGTIASTPWTPPPQFNSSDSDDDDMSDDGNSMFIAKVYGGLGAGLSLALALLGRYLYKRRQQQRAKLVVESKEPSPARTVIGSVSRINFSDDDDASEEDDHPDDFAGNDSELMYSKGCENRSVHWSPTTTLNGSYNASSQSMANLLDNNMDRLRTHATSFPLPPQRAMQPSTGGRRVDAPRVTDPREWHRDRSNGLRVSKNLSGEHIALSDDAFPNVSSPAQLRAHDTCHTHPRSKGNTAHQDASGWVRLHSTPEKGKRRSRVSATRRAQPMDQHRQQVQQRLNASNSHDHARSLEATGTFAETTFEPLFQSFILSPEKVGFAPYHGTLPPHTSQTALRFTPAHAAPQQREQSQLRREAATVEDHERRMPPHRRGPDANVEQMHGHERRQQFVIAADPRHLAIDAHCLADHATSTV